jgi:hypothetical protein
MGKSSPYLSSAADNDKDDDDDDDDQIAVTGVNDL